MVLDIFSGLNVMNEEAKLSEELIEMHKVLKTLYSSLSLEEASRPSLYSVFTVIPESWYNRFADLAAAELGSKGFSVTIVEVDSNGIIALNNSLSQSMAAEQSRVIRGSKRKSFDLYWKSLQLPDLLATERELLLEQYRALLEEESESKIAYLIKWRSIGPTSTALQILRRFVQQSYHGAYVTCIVSCSDLLVHFTHDLASHFEVIGDAKALYFMTITRPTLVGNRVYDVSQDSWLVGNNMVWGNFGTPNVEIELGDTPVQFALVGETVIRLEGSLRFTVFKDEQASIITSRSKTSKSKNDFYRPTRSYLVSWPDLPRGIWFSPSYVAQDVPTVYRIEGRVESIGAIGNEIAEIHPSGYGVVRFTFRDGTHNSDFIVLINLYPGSTVKTVTHKFKFFELIVKVRLFELIHGLIYKLSELIDGLIYKVRLFRSNRVRPKAAPKSRPQGGEFCDNCGETLLEGETLCGNCGTLIPQNKGTPKAGLERGGFCDNCGELFLIGEAFCGNCGDPIPQNKATPKPGPQEEGHCDYCGIALLEGLAFCDNCGNSIPQRSGRF